MYLIIPIGIFLASIGGILYITLRKFVYLRKLTTEAISNPRPSASTFWHGLFPEVCGFFENIHWREHRSKIAAEFEKVLRKLRIVFLKIDSMTHDLANRLRRTSKPPAVDVDEQIEVEEAVIPIPQKIDPKEEEQHLIMEIAKNPKDPLLYLRLGDIYIKTNDKTNALLSFETVLQLDPENWYAKKKVDQLKPA